MTFRASKSQLARLLRNLGTQSVEAEAVPAQSESGAHQGQRKARKPRRAPTTPTEPQEAVEGVLGGYKHRFT